MTRLKTLAAALAASTLLAGAAVAADQTAHPAPAATGQLSPQQKTADKDAGKLSTDGIAAYRDVHLARLAIFEAKPDQARMFVSDAQSALDKAKTDATAFTKAEADLKPPAGMDTAATMAGNGANKGTEATKAQADAGKTSDGKTSDGKTSDSKTSDGKTSDQQKSADQKSASTEPVKWLPVDAQLVLADDFTVQNKDQAKAIDEANQHLKTGDQKAAVDRLKLAGINVDFTMAVVPLAKTTQGVDNAAKLITEGKYYEANAALKQVEDSVRFDVIDTAAVPAAAGAHKSDMSKSSSAHGEAGATTGNTAKPAAK